MHLSHYHKGENGSAISGAWSLYFGDSQCRFKGWYSVLPGRRPHDHTEFEVALGGEDNMLQIGARLPLLGCCYVGVRVPRKLTRGWIYERREWTLRLGYVGSWVELLFAYDDSADNMGDYYRRQRENPNCGNCDHYAAFHEDPVRVPPASVKSLDDIERLTTVIANPGHKCITHSEVLHGSKPCACPGYVAKAPTWSRLATWPGIRLSLRPRLLDRVLGPNTRLTEEEIKKDVPCVIAMPEGNYIALGTVTREVRGRRRWKPGQQTSMSTWIEVPGGVPFPGKGENSWDCEDDAISGSGANGDSIGEACAKLAGSAMRNRERYGSGLSWVPDKGWPEEIDRGR